MKTRKKLLHIADSRFIAVVCLTVFSSLYFFQFHVNTSNQDALEHSPQLFASSSSQLTLVIDSYVNNGSQIFVKLSWSNLESAKYFNLYRYTGDPLSPTAENITLLENTSVSEYLDIPNIGHPYYMVRGYYSNGSYIESNVADVELGEIPMFINPEYEIEGNTVKFSVWCKENADISDIFLLYRFRKDEGEWTKFEDAHGYCAKNKTKLPNNWTKYEWYGNNVVTVPYSTYVWYNFDYRFNEKDTLWINSWNYTEWTKTQIILIYTYIYIPDFLIFTYILFNLIKYHTNFIIFLGYIGRISNKKIILTNYLGFLIISFLFFINILIIFIDFKSPFVYFLNMELDKYSLQLSWIYLMLFFLIMLCVIRVGGFYSSTYGEEAYIYKEEIPKCIEQKIKLYTQKVKSKKLKFRDYIKIFSSKYQFFTIYFIITLMFTEGIIRLLQMHDTFGGYVSLFRSIMLYFIVYFIIYYQSLIKEKVRSHSELYNIHLNFRHKFQKYMTKYIILFVINLILSIIIFQYWMANIL